MRWRAAQLGLEPWTDGEQGRFPTEPINWRLVTIARQAEARPFPDGGWRVLELQRSEEERPFWTMVLRLDAARNETDPR
jgi:hypothetical protein